MRGGARSRAARSHGNAVIVTLIRAISMLNVLSRPIVITSLCHYYYYCYYHRALRPQCTHKRGRACSFAVEYLDTYRGRSNDRDRPCARLYTTENRKKGGKIEGANIRIYRGAKIHTHIRAESSYIARKRSEAGINPIGRPAGRPEDERARWWTETRW